MSIPFFTITLGDDDMTVWLCFHTDAPVPLAQLQRTITKEGITYGIDHDLLADLAEAHQPEQPYCIAQGNPPDAGLYFSFSLSVNPTPKRLPDGRVDFYNLDIVQNIVEHQVLVTKIRPEVRQPGCTVKEQPIPPSYEDTPLPEPGARVTRSEDDQSLIALAPGYPVLRHGVLHIETTYTVEGNVDFSTGNLTCRGPVAVMGDVKSGFSVRSTDQVTIYGVVDGGTINAGGPVHLYSNVFGKHQSHIESATSVEGFYLDATSVTAGQDIVLRRGARHCYLDAGESILIKEAEGHIIGGTIRARRCILTHHLGSEQAIPTEVEILPGAYDIDTCTRFLTFVRSILEDDSAFLEQRLERELPSDQRRELRDAIEQSCHAVGQLSTYLHKRQEWFSELPLQLGTIVVTGTVYPGVHIKIGATSLNVSCPLTNVLLYKANGIIQVQPLEEHQI